VRLIDLFSNRKMVDSNAIEYFRQTVKTNNAGPVADYGTKPTSTFTLSPETDRCRVIAHLSQPVPVRLLQDVDQVQPWLVREMAQGLMAAIESQFLLGSGSGENMLGLIPTPGTTNVNFTTDPATTIRSALTQLQILGEQPNGIALHPIDAQALDLQRWGTGGGFLSSGFDRPNTVGYGSSDNIFGDQSTIRRVISPSVPQGFAIVADWSQAILFVRESMSIMLNFWGDAEFSSNTYVVRCEMRCVAEFLRPQAFAVCTLTAGS
jgi:Phage capsid family